MRSPSSVFSTTTRRQRWRGAAVAVLASTLLSLVVPGVVSAFTSHSAAAALTQRGVPVVQLHTQPMAAMRPAAAQPAAAPAPPAAPQAPAQPPNPDDPGSTTVEVKTGTGGRSQAVNIIILLTVLSIAPALLVLTTSFTKIAVVLSLTRNALGTPNVPPNQVLAGIALFLSIFVMAPVLGQVNDAAVQPYLKGTISEAQAFDAGAKPLRTFMLKHTGTTELQTMIKLSREERPAGPQEVSLTTLVPAFVLSELKAAFIIGFVIFVPFLVIDLVVASILMSMGMMMLPPVMISLPFKLLLFVMVDGWGLIATTLIKSYG